MKRESADQLDTKVAKAGRRVRSPTAKFLRRKEAILNAAAVVMNEQGLRGLTKARVARHFGIVQSGVTYYFSTKEALAEACFMRAIEVYDGMIADALQEITVEARLARLIGNAFAFRKQVATGQTSEITGFDDLRALGDEKIMTAYEDMFRHARRLFLVNSGKPGSDRSALNARVHLLLQQLFWVPVWLRRYDPDDYEGVAERTIDIFLNGLGAGARSWSPHRLILEDEVSPQDGGLPETFLQVATRLINLQGYQGASIDKIAAQLDVTKGAFYYHIDAKDDLVEACFNRTVAVIRRTQKAAERMPGDGFARLVATLASLVDHQLDGGSPLLRGAMASLPEASRDNILMEYERCSVRFGTMIGDGIADGSLRPVDTQIAAQVVTAAINGSAELAEWTPRSQGTAATEFFIRPLFDGLATGLPA